MLKCVIYNVPKQKIVILLSLLMLPLSMLAQQEPHFSHYWAMEPSFNPAAVGKEAKINVTGAYAIDRKSVV